MSFLWSQGRNGRGALEAGPREAGAPKHFSKTYVISKVRGFPGPVVKTALPLQGAGVQSPVREPEPHAATGIPRAAAEPWCRKIKKYLKK